jgi:hypothetical protein
MPSPTTASSTPTEPLGRRRSGVILPSARACRASHAAADRQREPAMGGCRPLSARVCEFLERRVVEASPVRADQPVLYLSGGIAERSQGAQTGRYRVRAARRRSPDGTARPLRRPVDEVIRSGISDGCGPAGAGGLHETPDPGIPHQFRVQAPLDGRNPHILLFPGMRDRHPGAGFR